mmetsp:Transcript_20309/g.81142  ORF Transcript_20309/g.81142 Transcript_20309/m.81142 type:complete len:248 (-) Transcript_20309:373-1116(-)
MQEPHAVRIAAEGVEDLEAILLRYEEVGREVVVALRRPRARVAARDVPKPAEVVAVERRVAAPERAEVEHERAGRVDEGRSDVELGDRPRARRRGGMLWCSRHGAVRSARETGRREPRRAARPDDRHAVEPRSVDALGLGGAPGAPAAHEVVVPEALVDEVQRGYHPPTHHARHLSVLEAEREVDGALVVRLLVGVRAEGAVDEEEDAARLRARRARWRHRRGCAPVRRRGEPAGIARPAQKTVGVR